jgi:PAS domain S-box-containing protein
MRPAQKVNILMVDDLPENLMALEAILGDLGQNLVKAHSGREALRAILNQEFALILLDVEMPGMDGFETAELVRMRKKSRNTPIIFLTAINKTDVHVFRGYSVGAVDYIVKPFVPEVLKSKVQVFVDLFRKTEEIKRQAELLRQTNRELEGTNKKVLDLYEELETKNAELQIERDFLSTVMHTAGCLLVIMDAEGRIIRFNSACKHLTGYTFEEVRGRHLWDLFLPAEEVAAARTNFQTLKTNATPVELEGHWLRRDGQCRLVAWCITPLLGNEGSVDYLIATGMDMTERKQREEERAQLIREQAARVAAEAAERRSAFLSEASAVLGSSLDYQATLASVPRLAVPTLADWCIVYTIRDDGSLVPVEVSHADPSKEELARGLWSYPLSLREVNHPVVKVVRTECSELLAEVSESRLESLAENSEHLKIFRQLGFRSAMVVPLLSRGGMLGVIAFVAAASGRQFSATDQSLAEDLARRVSLAAENGRLYQQTQEANRAKDEFLATVSHELRTPLNAILGWARMLSTGKLDEPTYARALETIERNAKAQARLIEDILDVSRIIMGKLRLNFQPVELAPVVESVLDAARPTAENKGVLLESSLDPLSGTISGDPDRLQQVAWNLVSNAVKFTPKGGRIRVRLKRTGSCIQFTVSDTGQGIGPDFLPRIFERFSQAESTSTRSHGGLGLGLAIVRHLVELHGGTVQAESPGEGRGATFIVTLPIRAVHLGAEYLERRFPTEADSPSQTVKPLDAVHVMVVDDESDARDLLTLVLNQHGAEVTAVAAADEALRAVEHSLPDVIICDIGMPGEDGYSFISGLRKMEPERGGRIPAVALTAYTRPDERMRALQGGYQTYVPKPIEVTELVAVVANLAKRTEVAAPPLRVVTPEER